MVTRRSILISGGACAIALAAFPAWAQAEEEDWICAAPDPSPDDGAGEIEPYGAEDFEGGIAEYNAALVEDGITPYGVANASHIWRKSDGMTPGTGKITLGVAFLDGTAAQHQTVETLARKWLTGALGRVIDFRFGVPRAQCQISITFNTQWNKSSVGRRSAAVARDRASMHLGQLVERTVTHEFGHALGLQHEHSSPNSPIQWNKPVVIADMAQQGWSAEMVENNIFAKFGPDYACIGDPDLNLASVMMYPIKRTWTLNGISVGQNNRIDTRDEKCLIGLYRA